jgi:hypothetical protein
MVSDFFRVSQDVDHEGAAGEIRGSRDKPLDRGEVKSTWVAHVKCLGGPQSQLNKSFLSLALPTPCVALAEISKF